MKISKLFHWLYAILMLLPLMVFIPNAFYYGFNEHAVAQEKTEQVPVYYESNDVTSISDINYSNIYHISYSGQVINSTCLVTGTFYNLTYTIANESFNSSEQYADYPYFARVPNYGYLAYFASSITGKRVTSLVCDIVFDNNANIGNFVSYISKSNLQVVKDYQPLVTDMSITDSMSYAWDSVWQNDLFSWSYGSFLTQPFIYIGNLFNVPVDNTLYYALSYWLDISIIWLTFDLLMYVPLLVHRWLDKGIIE